MVLKRSDGNRAHRLRSANIVAMNILVLQINGVVLNVIRTQRLADQKRFGRLRRPGDSKAQRININKRLTPSVRTTLNLRKVWKFLWAGSLE